jgi:hypothetical protein
MNRKKERDPILDKIASEGELFGIKLDSVKKLPPRDVITPLMRPNGKAVREKYLQARRLLAEENMRLPSHALHDDYLVHNGKFRELQGKGYYSAWSREIIAYPSKDGVFTEGADVTDWEMRWTLPAAYIPENAIGVKGVGLFIDPLDTREEGGRVVVIPGTMIILAGLLQTSGEAGRADPVTRIPLQIDNESLDQLREDEKRWFWRASGMGVQPLLRNDTIEYRRRNVAAGGVRAGPLFGVGGVPI